jgi:hypothetical protein
VAPPLAASRRQARVEVGVYGNKERTSGPVNAIYFDTENETMQGGSSNHGDDYGIAW